MNPCAWMLEREEYGTLVREFSENEVDACDRAVIGGWTITPLYKGLDAALTTDAMIQPLDGKDCVTGEPIPVVHADDCRALESKLRQEVEELRATLKRQQKDCDATSDALSQMKLDGLTIYFQGRTYKAVPIGKVVVAHAEMIEGTAAQPTETTGCG